MTNRPDEDQYDLPSDHPGRGVTSIEDFTFGLRSPTAGNVGSGYVGNIQDERGRVIWENPSTITPPPVPEDPEVAFRRAVLAALECIAAELTEARDLLQTINRKAGK